MSYYHDFFWKFEKVDYARKYSAQTTYDTPQQFPLPSVEKENILKAHDYADELFNFNSEIKKEACSMWDKFYGVYKSLNPENQYLLLERLLCGSDCIEKLMNSEVNILVKFFIYKTLTLSNVSRMLINFDAATDAVSIFTNLFISIRLLPPEAQRDFYGNLSEIHGLAMTRAEVSGQKFPELSFFIPFIFDFSAFPISYCVELEIATDNHSSIYAETMFDLFPLIVKSARLHEDLPACRSYLEKIWITVKEPMSASETWNQIALRLLKQYIWIPDELRSHFIRLSEIDAKSDLSLFLLLTVAKGHSVVKLPISLKRIRHAFHDHSEMGIKTQLLLSECLLRVPESFWDDWTLTIARKIKAVSAIKEKHILCLAYSKIRLYYDENEKDYYADLLKGLQENEKVWIKVLPKFLGVFRNMSTFGAFYEPFKSRLTMLSPENDKAEDKEYLKFLSVAFTKTLLIRNFVASEDLMILFKFPSNWVDPNVCCTLLLDSSQLNLSEELIMKIAKTFLFEKSGVRVEIFPLISVVLARLAQTTKQPNEFAIAMLTSIESKPDFDYNWHSYFRGIWNFFEVLAERATSGEVHELLISHLVRTLTQGGIVYRPKDSSALAMMRLVFHIADSNLSQTQRQQENLSFLNRTFIEEIERPRLLDSNFFMFALFAVRNGHDFSDTFGRQYPESRTHLELAHLVHFHRNRREDLFQVNDLMAILKRITTKSNACRYVKNAENTLYVIELIKEFQSEPYYPEIYS
jgi:hypothetical protein